MASPEELLKIVEAPVENQKSNENSETENQTEDSSQNDVDENKHKTKHETEKNIKKIEDDLDILRKELETEKQNNVILKSQINHIHNNQQLLQRNNDAKKDKPKNKSFKEFIQDNKKILITIIVLFVIAVVITFLINKLSIFKAKPEIKETNENDE